MIAWKQTGKTCTREDVPILHTEVSQTAYCAVERRAEPRIYSHFPAVVMEVGGGRQSFGAPAVLDNLSASGFYLRTAQPVAHGECVFVIAQVAQALVALRGTVLRSEPQKDGCGLAVAVAQYKIFSLLEVDEQSRTKPPRGSRNT